MKKSKSQVSIQNFIINKLKQKNKRYSKLTVNSHLFEQGVDSLDFFSLIFDVESKYKIKINQKLYLKLNTIKKFVKYLESKKLYHSSQ